MKDGLNILLVQPSNERALVASSSAAPLWPCILSAVTPEQHNVDFIQCSFEDVTEKKLEKYDLVGVSVWTHTANHAYQIGDMCKRLKVLCVMGGIHPYVMPNEAKQHCDSIISGEAEYVWQNVLKNVQSGKLKEFYRCKLTKPEDIPSPNFSILSKDKYVIKNIIETVRGCPFNCSFCSATLYSGSTYRYKPVQNVIQEIESWRKKSSLAFFVDVNVAANFVKAKELFRALSSYNLNWWGDASVNVASDDELLKLLSEAGCSYLVIGMESISKKTLKAMNKSQNMNSDYKDVVKKLHDYNIDVVGTFIFGMDTDTKDVFKETVEFASGADIDFPAFAILTPYPGTKIYSIFKKQGRLLTLDWSRYTRADVVFQPKNMTPKQLIEGMLWAYEEAYSPGKIMKRMFSRWRGLKRNLYNLLLTAHELKQVKIMKEYHMLNGNIGG